MKTITVVNTPELTCVGTHNAACNEFLQGFVDYGFTVSEANTLDACVNKTILLISGNPHESKPYLDTLNRLSPDTIYILWYYHEVINTIPFKKFIITGEHFLHPPRVPMHVNFNNIATHIENFVPLLLRANESPSNIGTHTPVERTINGIFMGWGYKPDWVSDLPNVLYHNTTCNRLIPYAERRDYYLRSIIAFGFHHDANITNYHVTQRVFEGLAYGCVVISDNPAAAEMTGGIVEYAANKEEFRHKYNYFLHNPDACNKKRLEGYEWCRKYGTNRYSASLFLQKINDIFGINYMG
jgi:spore maturation protein CgeB